MSFLIVPTRVTAAEATVWLGAIDEDGVPTLSADGAAVPVPAGAWQQLAGGPHRLSYARVTIAGLTPRRRCALALAADGQQVATGSVTPLPAALPGATETPFTVLLGSCFCVAQDKPGDLGRTYAGIAPPDVKVLCGDQVYLDAPWSYFLVHAPDLAQMQQLFFENYQATWEQDPPGAGFRRLLQDGATYFSSDDHEFWNNAPNAAAYARSTWTAAGRASWQATARPLYQAFQSELTTDQFTVGPLSFFVADTRWNRDADRNRLMADADFDALLAWIAGLQGPGVLVVGQPVFAAQGGLLARFTDWSLPDFAQYPRLAAALYQAPHSVVVLTGDVHYGRVASCDLPARLGGTPAKLIEVIASPLALVDKASGNHWAPAPPQFPAFAIPGLGRLPVTTETGFQLVDNHFLTVEFSDLGPAVGLRVKAWPVAPAGGAPPGRIVYEQKLY